MGIGVGVGLGIKVGVGVLVALGRVVCVTVETASGEGEQALDNTATQVKKKSFLLIFSSQLNTKESGLSP